MGSQPEPSSGEADGFALYVERVGTAVVLVVAGEVDMITAPALEERITEACAEAQLCW
jgi:anti-anti-sigma regulatory factor